MKALLLRPLLLLILPLLLSSCDTLTGSKPDATSLTDYQKVTAKYEAAVKADNLDGGGSGSSGTAYREVASTLTDPFIQGLPDAKLKPLAWMMRGVSEWCLKDYKPAQSSAQNGLSADPVAGSHNHLMLLMLPAFIADSEAVRDSKAAGSTFSFTDYPKTAKSYQDAMDDLAKAEAAFGPNTSNDSKRFFYLHKKRLLLNWDGIISAMNATREEKKQARTAAGAHLGVGALFEAIIAVNNELVQLSRS